MNISRERMEKLNLRQKSRKHDPEKAIQYLGTRWLNRVNGDCPKWKRNIYADLTDSKNWLTTIISCTKFGRNYLNCSVSNQLLRSWILYPTITRYSIFHGSCIFTHSLEQFSSSFSLSLLYLSLTVSPSPFLLLSSTYPLQSYSLSPPSLLLSSTYPLQSLSISLTPSFYL